MNRPTLVGVATTTSRIGLEQIATTNHALLFVDGTLALEEGRIDLLTQRQALTGARALALIDRVARRVLGLGALRRTVATHAVTVRVLLEALDVVRARVALVAGARHLTVLAAVVVGVRASRARLELAVVVAALVHALAARVTRVALFQALDSVVAAVRLAFNFF